MRVLVVEDDKKIATFVVKGLKQSGFAADLAPDGEEGLLMSSGVNYDVAIVDLMLPELDGLGLIQKIRANEQSRSGVDSERQVIGGRPGQGLAGRRR